jgi:hypothetical protein
MADEAEELAARIDAACDGSWSGLAVAERLRVTEAERGGPVGFVATVFTYGDGAAAGDAPPDQAELLAAVASQVRQPLAQAQLNDLCFERHWGHGGEHARAAVESYLDICDVDLYALPEPVRELPIGFRVFWLRRALRLARLLRDDVAAERAITSIDRATEASLAQQRLEVGVALGHIETLIDDGSSARVDELLEAARERYAGDGFRTAGVIELQRRRAGDDEQRRKELDSELVINWLDHANRHTGLIRMHFLAGAAQLARDRGLTDLRGRAITELQQIQPEELDLVPRRYEVTLPAEMVEARMSQVTGCSSWQEAFEVLIDGSPSGRVDDNRAAAANVASVAPFRSTLPTTRLGPHLLPQVTASTEDERAERQLVEVEMMNASLNAAISAEALRCIWAHFGPLSEEELATFLGRAPHVSPQLSAALARAFLRFFAGDAEGAALTAAPRVESLARALARALLPIYQTQVGLAPGQFPPLGALLPALREAGLDESWYRFLYGYLANPSGGNARNYLLHGFIDRPTPEGATLVLLAMLYLAVGPVPQGASNELQGRSDTRV